MALSPKWKSVLIKAGKGLAAVGIAFLAKYLASPDVLNLIGSGNQWIILAVVVPGLLGLEKYVTLTKAEKQAKQ